MNSSLTQLRNNYTLDSNYFRYALRLVISCSFTVFLYQFLHLPNGYWAAFSVIACIFPTQGQSLKRAAQRILGTFLGMWFGIVVAHSLGRHLIFLDLFLPIFIFLTFYLRAFTYSLYVLFITVLTVIFTCLVIPGDWQIGLVRLKMTVLGTIIALLATIYIFPSRASSRLPQQLQTVRADLQQYFAAICQNYGKKSTEYLRSSQLQAFKNMQLALTSIQEARYEYVTLSDQFREQSHLYGSLESLYRDLLCLEIHLPGEIKQASLQAESQLLERLLYEIQALLLHFDLAKWSKVNDDLQAVLAEVRRQRAAAAGKLSIKTATFYEHIQLNVFIDALKNFLTALKAANLFN